MDGHGRHIITAAAIIALAIVSAALTAHEARADGVYLKNSSIISDSVIRVSDIFGGIDEQSDKVLGPAPVPGRDMTLAAGTLLRVALALDIPWRPSGKADRIVLRRAATVVGDDLLKQAVSTRLRQDGTVSGKFDIQFTTSDNAMILPHDLPPSAEVVEITFSPRNDWFQAMIAAPSADNPAIRRQFTGAVRRIAEVPVLKDTLRNGDIVRASDIDWIEIFEREIQHDYLLKAEDVIGMTPRRMVAAGKPVREIELEAPKLVERGDTVVVIFEHGTMRLTAEGRALRGGAKGDFVRVVNNNSSRTIEGIVTGQRTITVK